MDILGYVGYAILIFEAITGTIYVRRRAAGIPVIIMAIFFVVSSVILWMFGINKLHAWWLIAAGFIFRPLILKIPMPVYAVPLENLSEILPEWAKISILSPLIILVASLYASIVRIGVSSEKIRSDQQVDAFNVVNRLSGSKNKELIEAVKNNDLHEVQILLSDKDITEEDKIIALGWASFKGNIEIVEFLLENGIDVNSGDQDGRTALMLAIDQKHLEVAKILLSNNADINAKTLKNGQTALMTAATMKGNSEIISFLLGNGAEINAKNNVGATALLAAACEGDSQIVNILLENGANVNARTDNGITALLAAKNNGHAEIARLLEKLGAKI